MSGIKRIVNKIRLCLLGKNFGYFCLLIILIFWGGMILFYYSAHMKLYEIECKRISFIQPKYTPQVCIYNIITIYIYVIIIIIVYSAEIYESRYINDQSNHEVMSNK